MARPRKPSAAELRELALIAQADYFTVFRVRGRGANLREEHPTLADARNAAEGDVRALIYAVIKAKGRSIHVPSDYSLPAA